MNVRFYTSNIVRGARLYLYKYNCIFGCDIKFSERNSPEFQVNLMKAAGSSTKLHQVTFQKTSLLFHSFLQCTLVSQHREQNGAF